MPACCSSKKVSEPEVVAQTAPESKVIERNTTAESPMPVQEPTRTQEAAEPEELNAQKDKVEESVKEEPSFEEWVANGKKIPEGLVFAGGSPWFDWKTGQNRSDRDVFDLIFGRVAEGRDLKAEEVVKDEPSFEEWVANGKKIPDGLAFAGGSPWFDEKTGKHRSDKEVYELIIDVVKESSTSSRSSACPREVSRCRDPKVEEGVKKEPSFEEWLSNGKKIPESLVFAGGSPWFEEKTGKNRSDREVFDLIFGGVTEGSDLKAEEGVKDEPSFEEWVANGKKIPEGLAFAGGSPSFDEKTGKNRSDREVFDLIFRGITGGSDTKVANGIKDEPSFEEWVANGKNIPGELVFAGGSPWFDEKTGKNRSDKEVYGLIFGGVTESDAIVENSIDDEQPVVPNGWFCCGSY